MMTDKQYVIRAAKTMKVDLIAPTRGCPGILAYANENNFNKCIVDSMTWAEARTQINAFAKKRAA